MFRFTIAHRIYGLVALALVSLIMMSWIGISQLDRSRDELRTQGSEPPSISPFRFLKI
jgi:hypothetical protein